MHARGLRNACASQGHLPTNYMELSSSTLTAKECMQLAKSTCLLVPRHTFSSVLRGHKVPVTLAHQNQKIADSCIPAPAPTQKCKIHTWGSFRCRGFCQGLGRLTVQFRLHPADAIHFRLQKSNCTKPKTKFS
jgi:hypothetical protein